MDFDSGFDKDTGGLVLDVSRGTTANRATLAADVEACLRLFCSMIPYVCWGCEGLVLS